MAIMRSNVRETAADRPGVYRMLSSDGEIVYVGKSKQIRSRLLSYFRCAYPEEKGAHHAAQREWRSRGRFATATGHGPSVGVVNWSHRFSQFWSVPICSIACELVLKPPSPTHTPE